MPDRSKADIAALTTTIANAYRTRDLDALTTLFATTHPVTAFGTGVDETCIGLEEVRAQFKKDWVALEAGSVEFLDNNITINGDVAWVMSSCTLAFRIDGVDGSATARSTLVCVAESGAWRIAHWHISIPAWI